MAADMAAIVLETRSYDGRVATVTLNRPQQRNAMNMAMRVELATVF